MIPVFKPWLGEGEKAAAREALDLGWLGMGSYVSDFEEAIRRLIGASDRHVVAVSTGHAALHLSLLLAAVGPGDEVITPSFNNITDFQAILATGAKPVFCDILDDTLCLDVKKAAQLVGPRTRAIIAMDYDCHICAHDEVAALAATHGLRVVHDAAHSIGSSYKGRPIGCFSDLTMFSFDPVKTVTAIDGGAIVVRSEADVERLHQMRLVGMMQKASVMYRNERSWNYDVQELGFRYHLANLHAAVALAQLSKFERIASSRRQTFAAYNDALTGIAGLILPKTDLDSVVPFMYYVRVTGARRDALREHLKAEGVDTGIHWQPGHRFTLFSDCRRGDLSVTERICDEIVTLPFHSNMRAEDFEHVVSAVKNFFATN